MALPAIALRVAGRVAGAATALDRVEEGIKLTKKSQREFKRALDLYAKTTSKDISEIINDWGKRASFAAARKTPVTKAAKITPHNPLRRRHNYQSRLFYALSNSRQTGGVSRLKTRGKNYRSYTGSRQDKALQLYNKAKASRGYIKVGWFAVGKKFGANVRTQPTRQLMQSTVVKVAKPTKTEAFLKHGAFGSQKVTRKIWNRAVLETVRNRKARAESKLAKTARRYSG